MAMLVVKIGHRKGGTCYDEIGLCAQTILGVVLGSIVHVRHTMSLVRLLVSK